MSGTDDLAAIAGAFGLRIDRASLEQWAPILRALFEDLARMIDLPTEDHEPAFVGTRHGGVPSGGAPLSAP